ncbi:hypothetical protein IAT38_005355 [Cryptococcus sp. DSM 104549]
MANLQPGASTPYKDDFDQPSSSSNALPYYPPSSYPPSSYPPSSSASRRPPSRSYIHDHDSEGEDTFDPMSIDPELRLRTVKTAHSVIAESIRSEALAEKREKRRRLFRSMKRKASGISKKEKEGTGKKKATPSEPDTERSRRDTVTTVNTEFGGGPGTHSHAQIPPPPKPEPATPEELAKGKRKGKGKPEPARRSIFVNIPLPPSMLNPKGEPIVRYVRNKIRTSKYTLVTFLPKNLFEQFRRVANIYFLFLVILQAFTIFGAPNAKIGMLPLLAILGMTAIKDAIEDWRRGNLDNEVNNSAATKLEGWRNVNQPKDPRTFFERLFNMGPDPTKPSRGVKKLRDREASQGNQIIMDTHKNNLQQDEDPVEDVLIIDKESYPLENMPSMDVPSVNYGGGSSASLADPPSEAASFAYAQQHQHSRNPLIPRNSTSSLPSMMSRKSVGVMDWSRPGRGSAQWERTLWKKLEVGDLVLLRDNEQVPADIIVLSTSNDDGLCFIETKNLDGETNLKIRRALKATASISSEEDLEHAHFVVDSEPPHANLYTYNGVLRYTPAEEYMKGGGEEKADAITINELLLRGCSLRNTKWVIGMVVFTGADTKIMMNGGETPSKRSKIEKETNFNVVMNFVILIVLCLVTAILHGWYRSLSGTSADLYEPGAEASDNIYLDSVIIFFSCLLVFQNIVPISLYITVEVVKTVQAYFIFQDIEMYYQPYDTPCVPKTWNISDDLGQIEYVFSDKTGTLTQNIMEFKKCSIQGVSFGEGLTEAMMGAAIRDGQDVGAAMDDQEDKMDALKEKMVGTMKATIKNRYLQEDKLTLIAPELAERVVTPSDPLRPFIIEFFRALAICHSVLADTPDPDKPFVLDYKAESPDEAALVAAARDVGFPFVAKNNNSLDIEVLGVPERWTPLRLLEFNSSRKRMSVVARGPDGRIVLFCKGADSVIYGRLDPDHDEGIKQATLKDLETYANGGLRTLCISYRYLSEEEYADWARKYDAASAATVDREEEIEKACELVEHSLTILGATALEDKLQEGVPEAIATLHRAGIKLWVLTGDKLQTAIEIGYSCNLLTNDMEVMIISADNEEGARQQIEAGLNKVASVVGPPPTTPGGKIERPGMNANQEFAVVIDGESLRFALQPSLKGLFLSLGTQCSAVICCRVSPSQKALTVRLVKEGCNAMTLSIGDGANDVAMIQEANVGVGLYGLEGSQAAMSADYAFGQFRFLTRLLLVHGRWSYVRIADMHANFFYKNVIWTVSMFWFLIFSSFDATYLFDYTLLLFYNTFFTSLPVGILGAFDQDVHATASMAFPQLYKRGIAGLEYTRTRFWFYMTDGLYQSAVIFFIPMLAYGAGESWSSDGRDTNSLWDFGTTVAAAGVLAANSYIGINSRYWTVVTWVVYVGSTLLVFLWIPIYSALGAFPYSGVVDVVYPTFSYWAIALMTTAIAVGPRWFVTSFRQSYFPRDKEIIREAWVSGQLKKELGVKRRRDRKKEKKEKAKAAAAKEERARDGELDFDAGPERDIRDEEEARSYLGDGRSGGVQQFQKTYGYEDDSRGAYEAAAMYSPRKDISRSPLMSDGGTPHSQFSYPPSPAVNPTDSPSYQPRATVPPPLTLRISSDPGQPSPLGPYSPASHNTSNTFGHQNQLRTPDGSTHQMETPVSQLSYTSPTAFENAEAQVNKEVQRLRRTSQDLMQTSFGGNGGGGADSQGRLSRGGSLNATFPRPSPSGKLSSPSLGGPSRQGSLPLPGSGGLGVPTLSPVRGSFDVDLQHREVFEPSGSGLKWGDSYRQQSPRLDQVPEGREQRQRGQGRGLEDQPHVLDFSDEAGGTGQWGEEADRRKRSGRRGESHDAAYGGGYAI